MDAVTRRVSAWDGLPVQVHIWDGGDRLPPVLCLPGLVRTGGDFQDLAPAIGAGRRVVSLDYAGRGGSGRARNVARYAPEACLRDVLDVCAALHVYRAVVIGTSFGGLLSMAIAAARPGLLRAAVLNDIGPEIGNEGSDFVREFVALDPGFESLDACVGFLRERLPPLSLDSDMAWQRMAALTYQRGDDGRFHPLWDTRIARLMDRKPPDLGPLFGALCQFPTLLVHGERSNILLPDAVERMRRQHQDMEFISVPGVGHAPTLTEPPVLAAIRGFLERNG